MSKFLGGGYKKQNGSRNRTIDFIRGTAILLVVLSHNIQYGSGKDFLFNGSYFENVIFKFIYSFHMPLFAILSGYVFFWSMKKAMGQILKKRLTSLLIPILCWVSLECVGRVGIMIIKREFVLTEFIHLYIDRIFGSLWFLWAILWCSLAVLFVEKLFQGRVWIYGLILVLLLFTPAKYNFHLYAFMYPYFVSGFLFNKFDGKDLYQRRVKTDWHALVVTGFIFGLLFLFYGHDSYIYTTGISLFSGNEVLVQLAVDIHRWIIGFTGSILIILLCKMICDKWQGTGVKIIAYFGQISLGVYILNSYVNAYVLQRPTSGLSPNIFIWIAETVISMIFYSIAVEIIKKIPVAKKLLLGGR